MATSENKINYWSYAGTPEKDSIVIEHLLRYADIDPIKEVINKYGIARCIAVWEKTMIPDKRIKKLNYFLAKFIFKVASDDKTVNDYFLLYGKTRGERIAEIFNNKIK